MNKSDLVDKIALVAGLTKFETKKTLESLLDAISNALHHGEKITLFGFGTFYVITRKTRNCRHPRTGEILTIPTKNVCKFTPSTQLKKTLSRPSKYKMAASASKPIKKRGVIK